MEIDLDIVNFDNIKVALEFNNWGDVIIWRSSSFLDTKIDRYMLYEYLQNNNKAVINLGQSDGSFLMAFSA